MRLQVRLCFFRSRRVAIVRGFMPSVSGGIFVSGAMMPHPLLQTETRVAVIVGHGAIGITNTRQIG